ncbi:MAG: DEAD/DEAH box helicase, partial [Clostridiales Family XIII bacterium]|nr:DEAD/DEAH box helicase [Clostridiales Family XIII bacterium]
MAYKKLQFIGFTGAHIAPVCAALLQERQDTCLLVTPSFERARMVAKNLSFFTDRKILILPEDDPFFFSFQAKSRSEPNSRLEALISMHKNDGALILCPVSGAVKKMLPVVNFALDSFELRPGASFDQADLQKDLSAMGYERVSIVENKGEFAVRGGIIDLFAPDANNPFRVDFFGNEIESIRFFETESQKSIADISSYYVYPAAEFLPLPREKEAAIVSIEDSYRNAAKASNDDERDIALDTRRNSLLESIEAGTNRQLLENYITHFTENYCILSDHLPSGGAVLIDDPDRIREVMELRYQEAADDFEVLAARGQAVKKDFDGFSGPDDLNRLYRQHDVFFFTVFAGTPEGAENITEQKNLLVRQPAVMGGNMTLFLSEIKRYVKQNYEITIVCSTDERLDNLRGLLAAENVGAGVRFERGELETGTEILSDRKVWLWDGDIFRTGRKKKTAPTLKDRSPIRSFNDIRSGDFVVHESHGIGKFIGIEEKTVQGNKRDYLKIKYAGNDMLFVPIDQMSVVQKYIGGGETAPKIHKLSGMEWKNAKARARADIEGMAAELVAITAARQAGQGFAFSPDTVWQKDFEDKFPYEETDDQIRCIASIKRDMERPVPMDRLLCGDVGYGKTEVALRAVFKCVCDGKQAAVLAPTTILARQHYETFSKRFEDFPFTVEMMSRFRTKAEQMETIRGLAKGTVDVVIGTHRLLSADVAYRDLGLLVIDEEQRFGVKHKEKIKTMKSSVDVLTLT